jgi:hypothetical protein
MVMKTSMKKANWAVLLGITLIAAGISPVYGGPLQRADVAADPAWLVHLDVDGLKKTDLGRFILSEMEKPEAQSKLQGFQSLFGFDLRKQLHGLTVIGADAKADHAVLVAYADFEPDRLKALAQAAQDASQSTRGAHTVYSWTDDRKPDRDGGKPRIYAAVLGQRVLFSQSESPVFKALEAMDGKSPRLAGNSAFMPPVSGEGAVFLDAGARKLDLPDANPGATILKLSQSARLRVGENGSRLAASLALEANDTEVATQIKSIADGLVALLKLQKDKPAAVEVAGALKLEQQGRSIKLLLALPTDRVVGLIRDGAGGKAQPQGGK